MNAAAIISGVKTGIKVLKAALKFGRRQIARKEAEHDKDYDGNGAVGSCGRMSRSPGKQADGQPDAAGASRCVDGVGPNRDGWDGEFPCGE